MVMGHFATGVTVVASRTPEGAPCGLTVNSMTSVSLNPCLILVTVDKAAGSHDHIVHSGVFAVSVLSSDQRETADRFSRGERTSRFSITPYGTEGTGSPILEGALAWFDCRIWEVHEGGDHSILIGEVVACDSAMGEPLIFFEGGFRGLGA